MKNEGARHPYNFFLLLLDVDESRERIGETPQPRFDFDDVFFSESYGEPFQWIDMADTDDTGVEK